MKKKNPSMTPEKFENFLCSSTDAESVDFLIIHGFINRERFSLQCGNQLKIPAYKQASDKFAQRCHSLGCTSSKLYASICSGSFFEGFSVPIRRILEIMLKYSVRQSVQSIARNLDISRLTLDKIIDSFLSRIPAPDFSEDKLKGKGKIVQVDETLLN